MILQNILLCVIINMDSIIRKYFLLTYCGEFFSMRYILASKSPRRKEILQNIGLSFEVITADTDESCEERDPSRLCEILSLRKGQAVADMLSSEGKLSEDDIIISSDTVVAVGNEILGKPKDKADALRMLSLLSGSTHSVFSGVALTKGGKSYVSHSETLVTFDPIPLSDLEAYVNSSDPYDKAGGYGIQGHASLWVSGISGCYFGVVGLPVNTLNKLHISCTGASLI